MNKPFRAKEHGMKEPVGETFDKWYADFPDLGENGDVLSYSQAAWNHQQAKIDALEEARDAVHDVLVMYVGKYDGCIEINDSGLCTKLISRLIPAPPTEEES